MVRGGPVRRRGKVRGWYPVSLCGPRSLTAVVATVRDPASRFVKWGPGGAQQSHQQHSLVEPIYRGPHAGEAPEFRVETFGRARLDHSTAHQGCSEIRSLACSPRPRDGQLVRLNAIPLQILWGTVAR